MNSLDQMECLQQNMNDKLQVTKYRSFRSDIFKAKQKTSIQIATSELSVTLLLIAAKVKQEAI
jgi:hypothetical protein